MSPQYSYAEFATTEELAKELLSRGIDVLVVVEDEDRKGNQRLRYWWEGEDQDCYDLCGVLAQKIRQHIKAQTENSAREGDSRSSPGGAT